jgi:hypothetical protein
MGVGDGQAEGPMSYLSYSSSSLFLFPFASSRFSVFCRYFQSTDPTRSAPPRASAHLSPPSYSTTTTKLASGRLKRLTVALPRSALLYSLLG